MQRAPNQSIFLKLEDDKDSLQRKEGIEGDQEEEGGQGNVLQPLVIDGYQQGGGGGGGKEGHIKLFFGHSVFCSALSSCSKSE